MHEPLVQTPPQPSDAPQTAPAQSGVQHTPLERHSAPVPVQAQVPPQPSDPPQDPATQEG
jgi:hypothetical protein